MFQQLYLIHCNAVMNTGLFCLRPTLSDILTRSTDSVALFLPQPLIESYRKSFCYLGIQKYNDLPEDIKGASYFSSFKTKLKDSMMNNYSA